MECWKNEKRPGRLEIGEVGESVGRMVREAEGTS